MTNFNIYIFFLIFVKSYHLQLLTLLCLSPSFANYSCSSTKLLLDIGSSDYVLYFTCNKIYTIQYIIYYIVYTMEHSWRLFNLPHFPMSEVLYSYFLKKIASFCILLKMIISAIMFYDILIMTMFF